MLIENPIWLSLSKPCPSFLINCTKKDSPSTSSGKSG